MIKEKWLDEILTRQFEMVGAEYKPSIVKKEDWFLDYTWTSEQENEFKDWLCVYLKKRLKFYKEYCTRQAGWFILHCGFRTKDVGEKDGV